MDNNDQYRKGRDLIESLVEAILIKDGFDGGTHSAAVSIAWHLTEAGYALVKDDGWHYVTFDEDGWFVEHSVACRQAGTLGTCAFGASIREIAGEMDEPDPDMFGRHRITDVDEEGLPSLERVH